MGPHWSVRRLWARSTRRSGGHIATRGRHSYVRALASALDLIADSRTPPASMDDSESSTRDEHFGDSANIAHTQPRRWKRLKLRSSIYARFSRPSTTTTRLSHCLLSKRSRCERCTRSRPTVRPRLSIPLLLLLNAPSLACAGGKKGEIDIVDAIVRFKLLLARYRCVRREPDLSTDPATEPAHRWRIRVCRSWADPPHGDDSRQQAAHQLGEGERSA
ncbi:hypothetical protein BJY59DRAFT_705003 [Rhodotorula toruloides]